VCVVCDIFGRPDRGLLCTGTWRPDIGLVEMGIMKGAHFQTMGSFDRASHRTRLLPEEATYLVDKGAQEIYYLGLPLSLQETFEQILLPNISINNYLVYAHMKRIGYVLLRFSPDREPEQSAAADPAKTADDVRRWEQTRISAAATDAPQKPTSFVARTLSRLASWTKGSPIAQLLPGAWLQPQVQPMVPQEARRDVALTLDRLRVIEQVRMDCPQPQLDTTQSAFQVVYDVYKPGQKFKKSAPGTPDFRLCIASFLDEPPTLKDLRVLRLQAGRVPLRMALVDHGSICFYSLLDLSLPTFSAPRKWTPRPKPTEVAAPATTASIVATASIGACDAGGESGERVAMAEHAHRAE
jgi:tRNA-splicing endonuclease subunit Sen54